MVARGCGHPLNCGLCGPYDRWVSDETTGPAENPDEMDLDTDDLYRRVMEQRARARNSPGRATTEPAAPRRATEGTAASPEGSDQASTWGRPPEEGEQSRADAAGSGRPDLPASPMSSSGRLATGSPARGWTDRGAISAPSGFPSRSTDSRIGDDGRHQSSTKRRPRAIVIALVLPLAAALIALIVLWWADRQEATPSTTASSASAHASASTEASSRASIRPTSATRGATTPAALPAAPGTGTLTTVRAQLKSAGFACSDEGQTAIVSLICTRYDKAPAMMVYVGGHPDGSLGRLSLDRQGGAEASQEPQKLQQFLINQFVQNAAVRQQIDQSVRKGTGDMYNGDTIGGVSVRGAADGSIVLSVDGWVGSDVETALLHPTSSDLPSALQKLGYACSDAECTRRGSSGEQLSLRYSSDLSGDLDYLRIRVEATSKKAAQAAIESEQRRVLAMFREGAGVMSWLGKQTLASGASGFAEGLYVDYYPASKPEANYVAALLVGESCWRDRFESC